MREKRVRGRSDGHAPRPIPIAHDISWVTKQIAIGSCIRDAAKMAEASRQGITHILNLSSFDNTKLAKLDGIRILWNYVSDDLAPKLPEVFRRGVNFAKPALAKKENKLLIHCAAGWHRAPMMALAILGSMGWKPQDAKRKIKECRPDVGFPDVYVGSVQRYLREESGRPVKSRMKAGRDQLGRPE
jgi:protein-tyrosine phosphatase